MPRKWQIHILEKEKNDKMVKKNGFVTISKQDVYEDIQEIKKSLEEVKLNLANHLEHHKTIEKKNLIYLGLIVSVVTFLIQFLFNMFKGG